MLPEVLPDLSEASPPSKSATPATDSCPLNIVSGTFGNRQGYQMESQMGPFTHMFMF